MPPHDGRPAALAPGVASSLLVLALLPGLLACATNLPMVDDVPPGEPLAIDGVWLDTGANSQLHVGAGRLWAEESYTSGIWVVKKGQIQGVDFRRTGPGRYEGWHPGYQGPYYLAVQPSGRIALLLRTKLFGDYQTFLERISIDDAAAFDAERAVAEEGVPWEQPGFLAAQPVPAAPPAPSVAPTPGTSAAAGAAPSLAVPPGTEFGRYHALLIGNNGYRHLPRLASAQSDVRAIAQVLQQQYGFDVKILENASRDDVLLALEGYRHTLTDRDNLLIYYAGHGWLDEEADEGYWLPVDATSDSSINWIPNATLTSAFKAIHAKHVLVVADSCYSGKLTRGIAVRNRTPDYLTRMASKRARMVISSGGLEPVLDGGGASGEHSVFATAFLDALRENQDIVDTTSLFSRIRREVMLHADQTPELADIRKSGHEGGDFLFVPRH